MESEPRRGGSSADETKIDVKDPWELFLWCRTLGITKTQLEEAINRVGASLEDIKRYITYPD